REGGARRGRAPLQRTGLGPQGPRVARRVGLQLAAAHRRRADPSASAHRHQRRARHRADLDHPGPADAGKPAGFLMRSAPVHQRGVALILVLTTVAILASIGVDFSYSSRVSLKLAENLRDETRAEYLARSAINLSRLLLHFQKQVDQLGGQAASLLGGVAGGAPTRPPAQVPGGL